MAFEASDLFGAALQRPKTGVTEEDLPHRFNRRWTAAMKATVVAAIEDDLLSADETRRRYNLDAGELASWLRTFGQNATARTPWPRPPMDKIYN